MENHRRKKTSSLEIIADEKKAAHVLLTRFQSLRGFFFPAFPSVPPASLDFPLQHRGPHILRERKKNGFPLGLSRSSPFSFLALSLAVARVLQAWMSQ
jgi:hypothetical protein